MQGVVKEAFFTTVCVPGFPVVLAVIVDAGIFRGICFKIQNIISITWGIWFLNTLHL